MAVKNIKDRVITSLDNFFNTSRIDAFGRLRIAEPYVTLYNKQTLESGSLFWSDRSISGSSINWYQNQACSVLSCSNTSGSYATRQSKRRIFYQPGRSVKTDFTFNFGSTQAGIIKRIGCFTSASGIFLEQSGSTTSWVLRSSISGVLKENRVSQASWNLDPLDGTGDSGFTLNTALAQQATIDFQWLGVGRVRTGFNMNGEIVYSHQFLNSNQTGTVYMEDPNLPVAVEIKNELGTANPDSMRHFCFNVQSEGAREEWSTLFSVDRGTNTLQVSPGGVAPLISLRLNSSKPGVDVGIREIHILSSNATNFRWALIKNPVISGVDAAVYQTATGSVIEYDISRTSANTASNGIILVSGYANQTFANGSSLEEELINDQGVLGTNINGTSEEVVLCVQNLGNTDTFYASMGWREAF